MRRLAVQPALEVVGLSFPDLDLTKPLERRVLDLLGPETAVILCSAIKRQSGDTLENYRQNMAMVENLCPALRERGAGRFVFFSSAAVYGEDVENASITERTPSEPTSYYGMAKHASERLLLKAFEGREPSPLVLLRPPTIYGPGEPGRPYGPTGFLRAALSGEAITLWGDGSELREFVFIEDAVAAVAALLNSPFSGILNLASGRSVSFREVLAAVGRLAGEPKIESRPRTKRKADQGFDNALLRRALPELAFTSLEDGLAAVQGAEPARAR